MGLLIAGVELTAESGVTMFVPCSHPWGHEMKPTVDKFLPHELKVGEAFFWL
jgi:ectoine hydroxylase-related dioxygenase (phytanoyl-CoA dioxygenase family)